MFNVNVYFQGVLGTNEDLGIDLFGGSDDPLYPNDNAIYIKSVNKASVAARKLRLNKFIFYNLIFKMIDENF